jgi:hypothetical protein
MKCLWEIFVPTLRDAKSDNPKKRFFKTRFHRNWDREIRIISGGLTIHSPAKGEWISPEGDIVAERMIPVKIYCTEEQINQIADFTAKYYSQKAIMFYMVSDKVQIKHYGVTCKE